MAASTNTRTRIEKRKRLAALFETGTEVRFGPNGANMPPHPEDIVIWVGPPNPYQREMAIRDAQGSRARAMLEARDEVHSEQYINAKSFIASFEIDGLIDYVLTVDEQERIVEARRLVLQEPEWKDFNDLRDAMRLFEEAGSPFGDPEWEPLMDRDAKFGEQVNKQADELRQAAREGFALLPRAEVEKRAMSKRVEQSGMQAFMRAYEEWMLYYACRDGDDHRELFFDSPQEIKEQPEQVQEALANALAGFISEAAEAKNSQAAESGSDSSVPPSEQETPATSTPTE